MNIDDSRRFIHSFLRMFFVLFMILVVLPLLLEHIIHAISGGISPGNGSIRVFKDLFVEKASLSKFADILKKIIMSM